MDVIRKTAIDFLDEHLGLSSLEKFENELESQLSYIRKIGEKLRFLSYLKDIVSGAYQEHAKVCPNPDSCHENEGYEVALYSIKQQYDQYYTSEGGDVTIDELPAMKFFQEGQYFDAYTSIKEEVKAAKQSIVLVDNYIDENTLAFFPAKDPSIQLRILTKENYQNPAFDRAVQLYNRQYENLAIKGCRVFHDRFLILDDKIFFHIGSSIKDAGNKVFIYTRAEDDDIKEFIRRKVLEQWPEVYDPL